MPQQISFIGAGHMAAAIIKGLIANGHPASSITATATRESTLAPLKSALSINTTTDNHAAVASADVVILAVKPQILSDVCQSLKEVVQKHKPLILSVAAGVRCEAIEHWLGGNISVIRTMPNTPSLVGKGACGMYANENVNQSQRDEADKLMQSVGITAWVEKETLLSAVTAIAGSAPAYFYYMIEALEKAGVKQGLELKEARRLAIQTALGAAEMCVQSDEIPETLKKQVMSPNGTTERAVWALSDGGFESLVQSACDACHDRAEELADQLDHP